MKKIIIGVLALVILGGGAFAAKAILLDKPADPQAFLNKALVNYFEIDSAAFTSKVEITLSEMANFNGDLDIEIAGKANKLKEYLPEIDYQISLAGSGSARENEATIAANGNLRILDEVFYGKLGKIEVTGIPNEALALTGAANAFAEKWFAVSFKKLKEADPKVEELFEQQKAQQLALRESLKNFFANNNVLIVESLPISFGSNQKVKTVLNTNILTSDAFLTELEKLFTPALPEDAENLLAPDEKSRAKIKQTIEALVEKSNLQITLEIGKKDGLLHGSSVELDLNLTDFGAILTGNVKITVSSQLSEINQPQVIETPENVKEIDPLALIPSPVAEEDVVITEEDETTE